MTTQFTAINLMATTARGIEKFEIFDAPDADFCRSADDFLHAMSGLDDGDVAYFQVMPAGTDGDYEKIDAEYGIR